MMVDIDVLSMRVGNRVSSEGDATLIVTMDDGGGNLEIPKIFKQNV
jgi:hypothetical protein